METHASKLSQISIVILLMLVTGVALIGGVALFGFAGDSNQLARNLFLVTCASICLAVPLLTAMAQKPYDILHPLNFIALSLFFGVFGRVLYIISTDSPVVNDLLDNRPIESIIPGAVLSAMGSILLCAGYVLPRSASFRLSSFRRFLDRFSGGRFMLFLPILFAISAFGIYSFLKSTGFEFSGLTSLSEKRRVVINGVESSMGYTRLIAQELPRVVFLTLLGIWLTVQRRSGMLLLSLVSFGVIAIALPFLSSSRGIVIVTLCMSCVLINRLRSINLVTLLFILAFAIVVIFGMLAMRRVHTRGMDFSVAITEMGLEPLFGNHSFADVVKLGHIYTAVPDLIGYKYGSSFIGVIYAPIPRAIWKNKPEIAMGREITEKIYNKGLELDDKGGGTPPGLFGEAIINFSIYGFPIAIMVVGALLRLVHNTLHGFAETSIPGAVLYAWVIPTFCLSMMSGDFTRSLTQAITAVVMVVGVTILARTKVFA